MKDKRRNKTTVIQKLFRCRADVNFITRLENQARFFRKLLKYYLNVKKNFFGITQNFCVDKRLKCQSNFL